MTGPRVLLAGLLLLAPALAGCADDAPEGEAVKTGSSGSASPPVAQPSPASEFRAKGTSDRWHFHDYWKGNPVITLLDTNLTFNATPQGAAGVPALSALFALPHGVIVPPETGYLTINVSWDAAAAPGGLANITYKPADSNSYFVGGEAPNGVAIVINTSESNCDVPHRQASAWIFNITAAAGGMPPGLPAKDFHITVAATIGRPLFIDPPHLNWWRDGDIIPLVVAGAGDLHAARSPAGNVTLPGIPSAPGVPSIPPSAPSAPTVASATQSYRVPVDQGRIVPEGAKSIVVMLNWTTQSPQSKLTLRFSENNYPSEGALELATDNGMNRVFTLPIAQAQTDTTYSNRTTWEFHVLPEGEPAAAFEGSFTLVAWATRMAPDEALAAIAAPSG